MEANDIRPSLPSRVARRLLIALYRWKGWRLEGCHPGIGKFVITGAPDFVFFLGATNQLGIRPSFMGKEALFRWPIKRFMRDMGGVPIDRSKRGSNYVEQAAQAFAEADELALVVAPEGSRSSSGTWRSGFWHIARAAGVPIVPAWVDNRTMRGGIGAPLWPSDDFKADLARLAAFYRSVRPDCERFKVLEASLSAPRELAA